MEDVVLYFMQILIIACIIGAIVCIIAAIFSIDLHYIYDIKDEDYLKWENFKKNFWK